jgi:Family of unknown function (DUF5362)
MENPFENNENKSQFDSFELQLNNLAIESLKASAGWSMFLAVMGFIAIGLMVLGALAITLAGGIIGASAGLGGFQSWFGLIYIVIAALYAMPVYYLFKYSSNMKTALNNKNSEQLSDAFLNLKSHHKFLGVSIIVFIGFYILMFIGLAVFGLSGLGGF